MFDDYWQHYQSIINAKFNLIRSKYEHSGNKGTHGEIILREFIRECFSENLIVGHGEVIDSKNKRTGQVDCVIAERDITPFVVDPAAPNMFIVESVKCLGEVKFRLKEIEKLVKQCCTLKELTPNPTKGDLRLTQKKDDERFYNRRPFFIFAYETDVSIETILSKLNSQKDIELEKQIDAIFILNSGAIINFGTGKGELVFDKPDGSRATGFVNICDQNDVLKYFIGWLTVSMPNTVRLSNPLIHYLFKKSGE